MSYIQKMIKIFISVIFIFITTPFLLLADTSLSSIKGNTEKITANLKTAKIFYEGDDHQERVDNTPTIASDLARIEKNNNSNIKAIKRIENKVNPEVNRPARTYLNSTRGKARNFRQFTKRSGRQAYRNQVGLRETKKKRTFSRSKVRASYATKLGRR